MGFLDKKKEYVIEDMYPKRPWMNYLWNEEYIAVINQFGFGKGRFSSDKNFQRDIVKDCDSRIIYLKVNDEIIAVNRNYLGKAFNKFETIVGLGYTTVISEYKGLQFQFTIIVPQKGKRECWRLVVKNSTNRVVNCDLYAFVDLDVRITEHLSCTYGDFDPDLNGVYFRHNAYGSPTDYHVVYFATDFEVKAYETARRRFVGVYNVSSCLCYPT